MKFAGRQLLVQQRQGTQRKRRLYDILSLAVVELVAYQPAQRRVRVHASEAHHAVVDAGGGDDLRSIAQLGD